MNDQALEGSLVGRVAIITGGTRGIGYAITGAFASEGARVTIVGRSPDSLDRARRALEEAGAEVLAVAGDVGDSATAESVIGRTVEQFGRVDVLVNNAAATARFGRLANVSLDDWDRVMSVNLRAPMLWSRLVYEVMREAGGGSVINIGSSEGLRLSKGLGCYAVSKAALQMLTRVCAREWAADGVRVNYLCPGVIDTEWSADLVQQIAITGSHLNPMNRIGTPEDVAAMAVVLASDRAGFVTGATIAIDGGETA